MARPRLPEEKRLAILADSGTLREVAARHGVSYQTVANVRKAETKRKMDEFFKFHAEHQTGD